MVIIKIPEYTFDKQNNPYSFHLASPRELDDVARKIDTAINSEKTEKTFLVRGIQSKHFDLSRDELIKTIRQNNTDNFNSATGSIEMYAAPFEAGITKKILEGFHKYKPKCEERPQYPVDIWMIYDKDSFDNIEYMHPRLKVMAKDKWKQKKANNKSLLKLIIVN